MAHLKRCGKSMQNRYKKKQAHMNYFEIRRQLKKKKDNFPTFQSDEMVNVLL